MGRPAQFDQDYGTAGTALRDGLARADMSLANVRPVLRHLLGSTDNALFSEDIVARVRGLLHDLATQLVAALGEKTGHPDARHWAPSAAGGLAAALADDAALLGHVHALAIEAQLSERLATRLALDPVLPPLVNALIASSEERTASAAMALLAAQARFVQAQRRGEHALGELPADLLHAVLLTMRAYVEADDPSAAPIADQAERDIRAAYDEGHSRLGLLSRLVETMGGGAVAALDLTHGGLALFVTALAEGSDQSRDVAILATSESQTARLALGLIACGIRPTAVEQQLLAIHPEAEVPEGLEQFGASAAAALLASSSPVAR
ncbi:hypothetical protein ACFO0A_10580 [Novosphingobium tardum]|uniref:DUF2336 domain-containing protein n=1 Tax=Novosphingobium tardum TaxID=1538021 RepID=A0ABV8RQ71_9SPHN